MIKIFLENTEQLEQKHLEGLNMLIQNRINQEKQKVTDSHLQDFLTFLHQKSHILLCGRKEELTQIINNIEENFFISKRKLSKIIQKRKENVKAGQGSSRREITSQLIDFARNTNLYNHLPADSYSLISSFDEAIKKLSLTKWNNYENILKEIFDYEDFSRSEGCWSAYDLVFNLNVKVCPYCNRSYVTTLKREGKKTRAVLDHYYAKALYPYLSLSLYNLIPSCYVCNSSFKGEIDFYKDEAVHPYSEEFLSIAQFKTNFKGTKPFDYKYLLGLSNDFTLNLEIADTTDDLLASKIKKSIETFALEDIYNMHKDVVKDLIRNFIVNNDSRIQEIATNYPNLFNDKKEVIQLLYLNYIEDEKLGERPFSKLTKDICQEFGILRVIEQK